jgi:peptidyl-prolyl cis-trans isomerase D
MLKLMREWFHSLKFLLWIVVASFVITIFAVWGGGREATRQGESEAWAARVEGETIPTPYFQRRLQNLESTYRQLYGAGYEQQRPSLRLAENAIRDMIDNRLIVREARRLGLAATADDLTRFITAMPQFRGPDGRFMGRERYENLLRSNNLDVAEFEAEILETLTVDRFKNAVFDAFSVSDRAVEEEVRRRNEKAKVAVLKLPLVQFQPAGPAGEADLRAQLEKYPERFRLPESRRGRSLILTRAKVEAEVKIPEEQVRQQYERDLQSRYTRPEQRRASHILFKVESAASPAEVEKARRQAEKVLAQARAGADFAALARQHSQDTGSAAQGGDLGFFGRGAMIAEFENEAFRLPVGQISDLVRSSYGFHVIKVTGSQPGGEVPFEDARAEIERALKFQRVQEEMTRQARTWAERLRAGDSLEKIGRAEKLEIQDTGLLTLQERGGGANTAMVQALFTLQSRGVSEPVPVPEGLAVLQLAEISPPSLPTFEQARARVEEDWKRERAIDRGREALRERGAYAPGAPDAAALARALSGEIVEAGPFAQAEAPPQVPAALRPAAFSTPVGGWSPPVVDGDRLLVLKVLDRPPVDPALLSSSRDGVRRTLLFQERSRLYTRILDEMRSRATIEINQPLIDRADRT